MNKQIGIWKNNLQSLGFVNVPFYAQQMTKLPMHGEKLFFQILIECPFVKNTFRFINVNQNETIAV